MRLLGFAQWACLVLLLALCGHGATLAAEPRPDPPPRVWISSAYDPGCPVAQRAITFYRAKYTAHREALRLQGAPPRAWYACDAARRRAGEWRDRAKAARLELARWRAYHYAWRTWLPRGWQGVARCETQTRWDWNSGTYQGAFGFAVSSWDAFVGAADPKAGPYPSEAYLATPRQQYEVALAIWRRYGLSGWGCRGAYYG